MKKVFVSLLAVTVMACTVSCKKEPIPDPVPVYEEGIYHPCQKLATVTETGVLSEEWNWSKDNLNSITMTEAGTSTVYNYSGDFITKVVSARDYGEEIRYTYTGNQISGCEIYYEGSPAVTMTMQHNAEGKLSGADIVIDDNFLLSLAGNLLGGGSAFERLVGRSTAESMILMAQLCNRPSAPKFEISNKTFSMNMQWTGENLTQLGYTGSWRVMNNGVDFSKGRGSEDATDFFVTVSVSTEDIDFIQQFINIPDEYLSLIQMAMLLTGGQLPLNLTLTDTVISTYDDKYNPMFCNWGEIFSPQNLSLNNVLTTAHNSAMKVSVALMGQVTDLLNQPQNSEQSFSYEYNNKNYPTKVISDGEKLYTYKE